MTSPVSSGWWGRGRFSRDSAPDPGGQTGNTQDNGGGDAGREKGKAGRGFPPPLRVWYGRGVLHGRHILKQPRPKSRFRTSPSPSRLQLPIPTKTNIQSGPGELLREVPRGRQRGARISGAWGAGGRGCSPAWRSPGASPSRPQQPEPGSRRASSPPEADAAAEGETAPHLAFDEGRIMPWQLRRPTVAAAAAAGAASGAHPAAPGARQEPGALPQDPRTTGTRECGAQRW